MKKILIFTLVASMAMLVGACSKTVDVAVTEIKVNPTEKDLKVGETVTLAATVLPENATEKTVKWISDNPTVASVEEATGKVVALRLGEAKITAIVGTKGAICNIRVVTTPVTSVTLNKTTTSLDVAGTEKLTATVAPSNATDTEKVITWSSNAPTVATVSSNGTITAVATGTATITATAKSGAKATCVVTVKEILATSVTIDVPGQDNDTALAVNMGAAPVTFTAAVLPTNTSNKTVVWTSSAPAVATVSTAGVVTFVGVGTTTITATVGTGANAKTDTVAVTVNPITVTALVIDTDGAMDLAVGGTFTFVPVFTPTNATDKSLIWQTTDKTMVSVDQTGKITAVGVVGNAATITATSISNPEIAATCVVTIVVAPAP